MNTLKKIMIGLDLTAMDTIILKQLDYLCDFIKPEKICFIHVHKNAMHPHFTSFDITDEEGELFKVKLEKQIKESVLKNFQNFQNYNCEFIVIEGAVTENIFKNIVVEEIDLLIVGKKRIEGGGLNAKNLCRNSRCSVLFIPEKGIEKIEKILNPIDFSAFSQKSTQLAIEIAKEANSKITALYIYDLPAFGHNAHYNNIYEPKVIGFATQTYNRYISNFDIDNVDIKPQFEMNLDYRGAFLAYNIAQTQQSDLIILCSHGKSAFNTFMIGSFTEKLMDINSEIPLLIAKCPSCFNKLKNSNNIINKVQKVA